MRIPTHIREVVPATPRSRIARLQMPHEFSFTAGQAVVAGRPGARGRPYSIASAPEDVKREGWLELLVGVDESGSPGSHLSLEPNAEVDLDGPTGSFVFPAQPSERRFIFVAGGTGIAPLRSMLRHALSIPDGTIGFFYSARTPEEFAYEHELLSLARHGRIELRQTVTRSSGSDWTGGRGRFSTNDLAPLIHDAATLCFVCGPPALVDDMPKLLQQAGVLPSRIKIEEWVGAGGS